MSSVCEACWTWACSTPEETRHVLTAGHHPRCPALGLPLAPGGLPYRDLGDGRRVTALSLPGGGARLGVGTAERPFAESRDYPSYEAALEALRGWEDG